MPHFAEINPDTNEVLQVIRADSQFWCESQLGGTWVRTYYSTEGKNYAGAGYVYHPEQDNFSPPQPYPSWTLDDTCHWQPPVAHPGGESQYTWDEEAQNWKLTHIWVTDENGALEAGDGLVTSNITGYFMKGESNVLTVCDCCDFAMSRTETYYSNIVSIVQANVITTSETPQEGYVENCYWTSNTISHYVGNVVSHYTNVVVYDGVTVYTNVEYSELETFTPVVVTQTSFEPREGFEAVVAYSNIGSDQYDANVHAEYTKVVTHYSNISVVEEVTYSNISVEAYEQLDTAHVVIPGYTNFYHEASNTSIRVQQYAALTPEQRAEYIVQTIEPVTSNLQSYYTPQTREVPCYIRELDGGVKAVCVQCDHFLV